MPCIDIVCSSAFFAAGVETETSRSAVGEVIVTYAAPFSALPGVALAQALSISSWVGCATAALATARPAAKARILIDIGIPFEIAGPSGGREDHYAYDGEGLDRSRRGSRLHPTMPDRSDRYIPQRPRLALAGNFTRNCKARRSRERCYGYGAQRTMLHQQARLGLAGYVTRPLPANTHPGDAATDLLQNDDRERSRQQDVAQQCDESEPDSPRWAASMERRVVERGHPVNQPCILSRSLYRAPVGTCRA